MIILSIDTSNKISSASLSEEVSLNPLCIKTISKKTINYVATQSQTILPAIDETISNVNNKTYDALAFVSGPGSFTGLRVGAATIKGLAFSENKKIIPISSLVALALNMVNKKKNKYLCYDLNKKSQKPINVIIPIIDARANRVYFSIFDENLKRYTDDSHVEMQVLLSAIKNVFKDIKQKIKFTFVGDGVFAYKEIIEKELISLKNVNLIFGNKKQNLDIIDSVSYIAHKNFGKESVFSENIKLNYLQASQAEKNFNKVK